MNQTTIEPRIVKTLTRTIVNTTTQVLLRLLELADKEGRVYCTAQTLALDLGISRIAVSRSFRKLKQQGLLANVHVGHYRVNPYLYSPRTQADNSIHTFQRYLNIDM